MIVALANRLIRSIILSALTTFLAWLIHRTVTRSEQTSALSN